LLHYLSLQNIPREQFEVIIVEYYSRHSDAIKKFEDQVDTWVALEMSEDLYYHKHLMYNVGIVASLGEICVICDSDAMAKPTFLEAVINAFETDPEIILHIDQFRNNRKDLYPFCYPSFEEVEGRGCINNRDGKTTGIAVTDDLIHNRNYGACFCAKREDLIKIGGADEHIDFIGHICGPYDFTFRLMNIGKKEVWHQSEFLYHTWHPGQSGENNYLGPHDGRHVSTTSLEALSSHRVQPHVINPAIEQLQKDPSLKFRDLVKDLILPEYEKIAKMSFLMGPEYREWAERSYQYFYYQGYVISEENGKFIAVPRFWHQKHSKLKLEDMTITDSILNNLKSKIDKQIDFKKLMIIRLMSFNAYLVTFYKKFRKLKEKFSRC
jgi:hypothetical protein